MAALIYRGPSGSLLHSEEVEIVRDVPHGTWLDDNGADLGRSDETPEGGRHRMIGEWCFAASRYDGDGRAYLVPRRWIVTEVR